MEVRWSAKATADLDDIAAFSGKHDAITGFRVAARVVETVGLLKEQPQLGRAGRWRGTRELIVADTKHVVVYFVGEGFVEILHVVSGRERLPKRN